MGSTSEYDAAHTGWAENLDPAFEEPFSTALYKLFQTYATDFSEPLALKTLLWWPWVRNYHGENAHPWITFLYPAYAWIDQYLKAEMGYSAVATTHIAMRGVVKYSPHPADSSG